MMIGAGRTVEDEGKRVFYGMGQPMSLTLSFREIPWFDVQGEIQRCDWSEMHFSICPAWISRLWVLLSQSRRCISTRTSSHGNFAKRQCERNQLSPPSFSFRV